MNADMYINSQYLLNLIDVVRFLGILNNDLLRVFVISKDSWLTVSYKILLILRRREDIKPSGLGRRQLKLKTKRRETKRTFMSTRSRRS
jgi:hypothetical protein